jgi:hypothetical protein
MPIVFVDAILCICIVVTPHRMNGLTAVQEVLRDPLNKRQRLMSVWAGQDYQIETELI